MGAVVIALGNATEVAPVAKDALVVALVGVEHHVQIRAKTLAKDSATKVVQTIAVLIVQNNVLIIAEMNAKSLVLDIATTLAQEHAKDTANNHALDAQGHVLQHVVVGV